MVPGSYNFANWTTPEVETAKTALNTSSDKATRWQAAQTLLTAMADDVPYIPLFSPGTVAALGNGFDFAKPLDTYDLQVNGTWVSELKAA